MATVATGAWPTLSRVEQTLTALDDASHDLEVLGLECYGLIDQTDPLEPLAGAPVPAAADLAALTVLIEKYGDDLETIEGLLDDFRFMRNTATYLMTHA